MRNIEELVERDMQRRLFEPTKYRRCQTTSRMSRKCLYFACHDSKRNHASFVEYSTWAYIRNTRLFCQPIKPSISKQSPLETSAGKTHCWRVSRKTYLTLSLIRKLKY